MPLQRKPGIGKVSPKLEFVLSGGGSAEASGFAIREPTLESEDISEKLSNPNFLLQKTIFVFLVHNFFSHIGNFCIYLEDSD